MSGMKLFEKPERVEKALAGVVADRRSGASELVLRALSVFTLARPVARVSTARYRQAVRRLARRVCQARPAMAPIERVAKSLIDDFELKADGCKTAVEVYHELVWSVRRVENDFARLGERVAAHFLSRFGHIRRPIVISYSSRVIQTLDAMPRGKLHVTVCESRPALEGRRMAKRLAAHAGAVTLITEAQIGIFVGESDCVVLGCDAIHADGSIVNKSGSYVLALAGKAARKPVVVIGDSYRLGPVAFSSENHPEQDVWRNPPRRVRPRNICFERVDAELLDYYVLETGVCRRRRIRSLWKAAVGRSVP